MSDIVIKIENLSKIYRLGEVGTGTLSHDLNRWWKMNILRQEDPYAKIGHVNDRTQKAEKGELVAALRDINLEVKQGEVLGIIGKNGAGKSTLLKLLSRVTSPTTGVIKTKGRLASLLEVGTGFHPEMTGRENIYMNGTIMGMRKWEISNKLDEIVDFAGVAKYLDTPTKRYSSGMTVRLGFAIAAFLEPELLIVDEVLAVGDFEFQKKAIGKMKDVSQGDGRTVLFVSHNMASIKNLCNTGIVLDNGYNVYQGTEGEAVDYYTNREKEKIALSNHLKWNLNDAPGNENIKITEFKITPIKGSALSISSGVKIEYTFLNRKEDINLGTTIEVLGFKEELLIHQGTWITTNRNSKMGLYKITFHINPYTLNSGQYSINVIFGENGRYVLLKKDSLIRFELIPGLEREIRRTLPGLLHLDLNEKIEFIENPIVF